MRTVQEYMAGFNGFLEVTLTLDTSPYAAGDVLAATQEIASALREGGEVAILGSLTLLDIDDQAGALDILILRSDAPMGAAENAPLNITDANAAEILTVVPFAAGDYIDLINSQLATKNISDQGMGAPIYAASGTSIWVAAVSRDTKTYTAAGLVLKIGLLR